MNRRDTAPSAAHRRGRRSQEGAVLVEAILVITTLILCLMGAMYLHQYHLKKLHVMRFSRVASMAYAMAGCPPSPNPGSYVSRAERGSIGETTVEPLKESTPQQLLPSTSLGGGGSSADQKIGAAWDQANSNDHLLSMEYVHTWTEGAAHVSATGGDEQGVPLLRGVRMNSATLCSEPIADRSYADVFERLVELIQF